MPYRRLGLLAALGSAGAVLIYYWTVGVYQTTVSPGMFSPTALAKYPAAEYQMPTAEYPAMSPDGTKLVFVSDVKGSRDLWLADADGTNAFRLTPWPDSDERSPTWTPDGVHILFSSTRDAGTHQVWRITLDGTDPIQLTTDQAEHGHPRVSPNGQTVLYTSDATGKNELWIMGIDGSNPHPVALITSLISDPSWSPAGDQIVYVGCRRGGACNLFVLGLDGSAAQQTTSGEFQDWAPDWGVHGIVFASNREDSQGLWVVQPDGTNLRQLTSPDGAGDLDPRWVGNSGGIVFDRSGIMVNDAASDIWMLLPDETLQRLTTVRSEVADRDTDGAADREEQGPDGNDPTFDGNADGIADWQQPHVTSLHSNDGRHYVTLELPEGPVFMMVRAVPNPSPNDTPPGETFPYGFYEFVIKGIAPGGSVPLTMHLPGPVAGFYKWGPRPDDTMNAWYSFRFDGTTGALFTDNSVTLRFVDGGRGDDDLNSDNGEVTDQGGPSVPASAAPAPALSLFGVLSSVALLLAIACVALRRRSI